MQLSWSVLILDKSASFTGRSPYGLPSLISLVLQWARARHLEGGGTALDAPMAVDLAKAGSQMDFVTKFRNEMTHFEK